MHFCNGCEKQSPLPFVTGPQSRIETGKAIIVEIVPQALKSYQHEGWDWLGGHLWPHALSWHEVALAIACQFPPAPGFPSPPHPPPPPSTLHQALLPVSFFSSSALSEPCTPIIVPGWWPLIGRKENLHCPVAQSWRRAITPYCFPSWRKWLLILLGEKMSLTLLCWCSFWDRTVKIPKNHNKNTMSNAVKIWAAGILFGPKGSVGEPSLH